MTIEQLVHDELYNPHLNNIEDIAVNLYNSLDLSIELQELKSKVLNIFCNEKYLQDCWYENILPNLLNLFEQYNCQFTFWSQGNTNLQTLKAQILIKALPTKSILKPAINVSLSKIQIVQQLIHNIQNTSNIQSDNIYLIDDRIDNIHKVKALDLNINLIRKIRPDRQHKEDTQYDHKTWQDIIQTLQSNIYNKCLILDLDGVIYNTTLYREKLMPDLINLVHNYI